MFKIRIHKTEYKISFRHFPPGKDDDEARISVGLVDVRKKDGKAIKRIVTRRIGTECTISVNNLGGWREITFGVSLLHPVDIDNGTFDKGIGREIALRYALLSGFENKQIRRAFWFEYFKNAKDNRMVKAYTKNNCRCPKCKTALEHSNGVVDSYGEILPHYYCPECIDYGYSWDSEHKVLTIIMVLT